MRNDLQALCVCLTLAACAAAPIAAQGVTGREGFDLPPRSDAGNWTGTWYYVARDAKWALWIRDHDGRPELKLRYLNTGNVESFETDWSGRAEYRFRDKPGKFTLGLRESDDKTIHGLWSWELGHGELRRTETARVTLYRSGDGRALVMNFEDLERYAGGAAGSLLTYPQVWTFRKASNNQRLWDELPF
jgi:hypothetical protein